METRAPHALVGLFVLAVIGAVFGFVFWLHNAGGLGARVTYQVRFERTVSGLLTGAAVLFNGIRVGEVTALSLDPQRPDQVLATIAIADETPIRADTKVGLDFQGLTGVPVIVMQGGSAPAGQWPVRANGVPVLAADPDAGQNVMSVARDALRKVDQVLSENAEPLKNTIANLKTFTDALARNSDRIDGIVTGIEKFTGVGGSSGADIYDLTPASEFAAHRKAPDSTIVVPDPTIPIAFDSRKITVLQAQDLDKSFATAQWADNVPKLVQARIIQSFENAGFLDSIGRPLDDLAPDYRLLIDIRKFQVAAARAPAATVALTVKLVGENGKILDAKIFAATAPAAKLDARGAASALNVAFGKVATEIVTWTASVIPQAAAGATPTAADGN